MRAYIRGRFGRASAGEMLSKLGVKVLPAAGMPERLIEGVRVYVRPLLPSSCVCGAGVALKVGRRLVCGSCGRVRRRNWQGLRVMAICECGRHVPVGRLHQHVCKV